MEENIKVKEKKDEKEEVLRMTVKLTFQQKQQQQEISCPPTRVEIEKSVDFILWHLEEPVIFPRKISTYKSENKQFEVQNKEDIIVAFKDSNFIDCRINAFPILKDGGYTTTWTPNILFIDLDQSNFKSLNALKLALNKTLRNIKDKLSGNKDDGKQNTAEPTVLWSGNGYHIIQPINCPILLENIQQFQKYEKPSQQFLRFAKDYLSNDKADRSNYPSFRSCLLRIPGSFNGKCLSKNETLENSRVKIIQRCNGYRPLLVASEILYDFQTYLIQKKIDKQNYRQKMLKLRKYNNNINSHNSFYYYYDCIEKKILANPFPDCRKIIVDLILAPYLIVIRNLSFEESYQIINEWLQKCNLLRKLDFNTRSLINTALSTAYKKQIPPMRIITLKGNYQDLSFLLEQKRKEKMDQ
jgi:hypothetical protein